MLRLDDFYHLPELDAALARVAGGGPGLALVAGLDPRPAAAIAVGDQFLPSGRTTIFRILVNATIDGPGTRAAVVAEDPTVIRVPRRLRQRVAVMQVRPQQSYAGLIAEALLHRPDVLVIDRLCSVSARPAVAAARQGVQVIAQIDTVFRGAALARHLRDLGVAQEHLDCLRWAVWVQRMATLCPACRRPAPTGQAQLRELRRRLGYNGEPQFFHAPGCAECQFSGRQGDVAVFDVFEPGDGPAGLPLERYAVTLAEQGYLALDDVLFLDDDHLRRTYHLLTAGEQALATANTTLERKLLELNAAHEVLQQRTAALISLQDIGQALIRSTELGDLVARVCRHASELCGADRAILYLLRPEGAEVCGVRGWDRSLLNQRIDLALVQAAGEPASFPGWPPGVPPRHADVEGAELRAGLRVPLAAEGQQVGLMIVHSTRKARFAPGEVALLRTFANQAALSIQRAGLIEQLRDKIDQLEAAQAALVRQERMEHEMELAREVQQSVLPRVFPHAPGYAFAACNQPARQVGGDFYDVIALDRDHIGLVIADVSDKGMPAALYMALTRSLLLAEARREPSPRAVLLNVNRLLRELGEPHMFVTVFYAVVALGERRLTYARAGHDYPLLLRGGAAMPLVGSGTVLGAFDDNLPLSEEQLELLPGDRLVMYTDGLTDVLDPDGRRFDLERLTMALLEHAALQPDDFCAAVFEHLAAYQGSAPQYDDMTMLVLAVEG